MKKILKMGLVGALSFGIHMAANAADSEEAIEYRQAVMGVIKWNMGHMGAMIKGKIPFDAGSFANRAANLAFFSKLPLEGFIPGSENGYTNADPKIWIKWDDFNAKLAKFQQEAAKLAEVAKAATTKREVVPQFLDTAKTCKGCHKTYKR